MMKEEAIAIKDSLQGSSLDHLINYGTILPVIANFSDWTFSEQVKSSVIKAAKDKKDKTSIIVS